MEHSKKERPNENEQSLIDRWKNIKYFEIGIFGVPKTKVTVDKNDNNRSDNK